MAETTQKTRLVLRVKHMSVTAGSEGRPTCEWCERAIADGDGAFVLHDPEGDGPEWRFKCVSCGQAEGLQWREDTDDDPDTTREAHARAGRLIALLRSAAEDPFA